MDPRKTEKAQIVVSIKDSREYERKRRKDNSTDGSNTEARRKVQEVSLN